jgi:hypothetical protein
VSRRTIYLIVFAALLLHAALFYVFGGMRALPNTRYVPRPNFGYSEEVYKDAATGERITYREIRVSTKLADAETLRRIETARAATPNPGPHRHNDD